MQRPELRALPPVLRVLCAGFLISLSCAYAVALLFIFVQSGMTPKGISGQFRGTVSGSEGAPESGSSNGAVTGESPQAAEAEEKLPSLGAEWRARDEGMTFPKPFKEMILTTHLHLLSISGILLMVGALFACSSFPEAAKPWIIAAGFAGLILDYACMWGVRYGGEGFSAGVFAFGFMQSAALAVQMLAGLKDLLFPGPAARP
jgi:hypothetical protein